HTPVKLPQSLAVPLQHFIHIPHHILLHKIAQLPKAQPSNPTPSQKPSQGEHQSFLFTTLPLITFSSPTSIYTNPPSPIQAIC
ncbi:YycC family protein, partial [Paenibacillus xylanexedens]|uniref:YycC family protein n=1 Tax=Paenibacillus xylanexedens TaxID=528191 RepID=UPI0011A09521